MEEVKSDNDKKETVVEIDFLSRMVEPHEKVSREVTKEDIPRVVEEAKIMYNLCFTVNGRFQGGYAIAHPQIDDKDPLRFFVTHKKEIIINPKMIRHTNHPVDSKEGCLSFPHLPVKIVNRFHRSDWEYQGITPDATDLAPIAIIDLSGPESKIFQHETDHLNGILIYPLNMSKENIKKDVEEIKRKTEELKNNGKTNI